MTGEPITLVLADDHPIVLDGLAQLFGVESDFRVHARCRTGQETLDAVARFQPDVLVLDLRMPAVDGLDVLHRLSADGSRTKVIVLTASIDDEQLVSAIRLGARGVVLKESASDKLVAAVRDVHAGSDWLDEGLSGRALRRMLERESGLREAVRALTPRELEVVRLVASGLRNRAISDRLFITEGTVKMHLHRIYEKLGVNGRLELSIYARDKGLL